MSPLSWVPHSLFDIQISFTSQHKPWVSCYSHPQGSIYPFLYNKGPHSQSCSFPSSHVQIWELDNKEGWVQKNWCFWTVGLEKTVESSLNSKEIKPVNPKGNQPWIFIGRAGPEAESPIWPPDGKSWLVGNDPDAEKDWRQEEKRVTEDEMVGWHHWLNGHEFGQIHGDGEGQGGLVCCRSQGCKVRYNLATEQQQSALICWKWWKGKVLTAQSCTTLWNPMDCSLPGSSVHGILQARILEWGIFSMVSSWPRIKPGSPELQVDTLPSEPIGKPYL